EHPNVVQVFDVSEHQGEIFLVMEYLEGKCLRDCIPEGGLPPDEAIALLLPAFSGVAAAHQAGILHRDLKPENLFVCCDRDGTPYDTKVLDFGLAKAAEPQADSKLTHSGSIVGTPRYMSPEQLEEKDVDERTDVYALGLILFECLVGDLPYRSQSLNALLLEILTADHPPPHLLKDGIPEELGDLVKKAIERQAEDRFDSVVDFARAIEPFTEATFRVPRKVHLTPDSLNGGLTPRLDDERISSSIRARPSSPSGQGLASTKEETPQSKQEGRSEQAFAPTAALSTEDVAQASTTDTMAAVPPRPGWIVPAAVLVGLLVVGVGVAAFVVDDGDPEITTPSPAALAEPAAVIEATEALETAEAEAEPTVVEPPPAAIEPGEETPEAAPEAADETPEAPVAEAPAPHTRGRRHHTEHPTGETPAATPATTGQDQLRVNSRAGVLRADDF
ncbi:MAG: protein kinase, partial [Myxococcales bacterium]|nr:protein kinase [Myxococcales bacterium]